MAIGSVAVEVVPDATDFWRRFRERTAGQAENEGRRSGAEFRRGLEGANTRPIQIRADLDAARLRAQLADLTRSQAVRVRADVDTTRARAELKALNREGSRSSGGLLKAILPLAPALFPLAGAALAAGSGLAILGGAGVIALTGLKREMGAASETGDRAAATVRTVKNELHSLQASASKAALPGLEASVVTIRRELPALRKVIDEQASVAGDVIKHLTSGIVGGFTTFRPIISAVGTDVDSLAAHFDSFANGPGGARFAKTLASDYAEVKPVLESVVRAVVDIARAGSTGGLGVLHILGELSNIIDSFPTPVLTAIVDGFLLFRAVGVASAAIAGVKAAFSGVKSAAAGVAAATQLAAAQRIAAETQVAAVTAAHEAAIAEDMLRTAVAAREELLAIESTRGGISAAQETQLAVQLGIASRSIASYEEVAAVAAATAVRQAAAAEAAAGAAASTRATAGAASAAGAFTKVLLPIALVGAALPLLSGLFGDNGQQAQEAASQVGGYASALVNSRGAIDASVRSQVAKNLVDNGAIALAKQAGVSQSDFTNAVIAGGSALDSVIAVIDRHAHSQGLASDAIDIMNDGLRQQHDRFAQGATDAADQAAAVDQVTAADRAHAAALHTTVSAYEGAREAASKSIEKTREQTVAFQLDNDAASLLSNALKTLAGQNLGVSQAQTAYEQSLHSVTDALKENGHAVLGNKKGELQNQQAIQGSVSAARQLADAVAKQTGSSDKAAASYRRSRNALLDQLAAHHQLTPALRKYINGLFDVKGVSDYLAKHPTKLDVNTAAGRAKLRELQGDIDSIRQRQATGIGVDDIAAVNEISRLQGLIDAMHGKTVTITTISSDGSTVNVGNQGRGFRVATGGPVYGPGSGTSDSIPAWLSNGEYVINAKATAKHRHLLDSINKGARGFAAGGPAHIDGPHRAALNAPVVIDRASATGAQIAANKAYRAQVVLGVKIENKDLNAFKGALNSTASAAHSAFQRMYDDARKLGIDNLTAKYLRTEEREVEKLINQRNRARDAFKQLKTAIKSSISGSFDVTSAGGQNGGASTFGSILAEATQDQTRVRQFVAGIKKLAREGLNKTELAQLASAGPSALPQVKALEAATPAQLRKLNSTYASITSAGDDLGQYVGNKLYGKTIRQDDRLIARDERRMAHALAFEVDRLSRRPIEIKVDGKIVARAGDTGRRKNGRRS